MRRSARLGLRWMRQRPLASAVAILCLALGLGAAAAAVMLADASVMRPYGIQGARDLVVMWETDVDRPRDVIEVSLPTFQDWQHRSTSFESLAAFDSSHWPGIARVRGESIAVPPRGVSQQFFRTLGRAPLRSLFVALVLGATVGSVAAPMAMRLLASMGIAEAAGVWFALARGTIAVALAATTAIAFTIRPAMKLPPAELLRAE